MKELRMQARIAQGRKIAPVVRAALEVPATADPATCVHPYKYLTPVTDAFGDEELANLCRLCNTQLDLKPKEGL